MTMTVYLNILYLKYLRTKLQADSFYTKLITRILFF